MATVREIIERAARKIGILSANSPLTAVEAAQGVAAFNAMMHGFASRGANTLHADLDLNDTVALPPKLHEALVYVLATRIAPDFNAPAPDADRYERSIQAHFLSIPTAAMPRATLFSPSRPWRRW